MLLLPGFDARAVAFGFRFGLMGTHALVGFVADDGLMEQLGAYFLAENLLVEGQLADALGEIAGPPGEEILAVELGRRLVGHLLDVRAGGEGLLAAAGNDRAALALIGLGVFVYGDLATNRTARIVGVTVVTLAVVVAAILASNRDQET